MTEVYESPKARVINAINALGRRVTIADIARDTGLPLSDASDMLNSIAHNTGGQLQVSEKGEVVYTFHPGFASDYGNKGSDASLLRGVVQVYNPAIWFELLTYATAEVDKNEDEQPSKGFLVDTFSFVFGQSNLETAYQFEQRRWRLIADVIQNYHGAVTCEQLAPYLDHMPGLEEAMLPVLARFHGHPGRLASIGADVCLRCLLPCLSTHALLVQFSEKLDYRQQE